MRKWQKFTRKSKRQWVNEDQDDVRGLENEKNSSICSSHISIEKWVKNIELCFHLSLNPHQQKKNEKTQQEEDEEGKTLFWIEPPVKGE